MTPKFRPSTAKQTSRSSRLIKRLICEAVNGRNRQMTTAIPDTPPKEKLLGNLKT